jgi:hypothetical protein
MVSRLKLNCHYKWFLQSFISLQGNSELCLHPYPSQYLQRCTAFSLALLVCHCLTCMFIWLYFFLLADLFYSYRKLVVFSFSGTVISSVHKHEFHAKPHYYWAVTLPWDFYPPVLQWILESHTQRPRPYSCWMGEYALLKLEYPWENIFKDHLQLDI